MIDIRSIIQQTAEGVLYASRNELLRLAAREIGVDLSKGFLSPEDVNLIMEKITPQVIDNLYKRLADAIGTKLVLIPPDEYRRIDVAEKITQQLEAFLTGFSKELSKDKLAREVRGIVREVMRQIAESTRKFVPKKGTKSPNPNTWWIRTGATRRAILSRGVYSKAQSTVTGVVGIDTTVQVDQVYVRRRLWYCGKRRIKKKRYTKMLIKHKHRPYKIWHLVDKGTFRYEGRWYSRKGKATVNLEVVIPDLINKKVNQMLKYIAKKSKAKAQTTQITETKE